MANSRPLLRSDMLLGPLLSGSRCFALFAADPPREMRHFDGAERGFESFVATLQSGAVDGLLQCVAGQHAKHYGHAGIHLRELQPARGFRADIVVMRRLAAQHAADGDKRVVLPCRGNLLRDQRQFKGSRHMHHINILALCARAFQSIRRRGQQPLGNKTIEPAHNNSKPQSLRGEFAANLIWLQFFRHDRQLQRSYVPHPRALLLYFLTLLYVLYFPLNCGGRFSKNAFVPSRISSVAQHKPNKVASRNNPSSCGISIPRSMASMAYCTATGAFASIFLAIASAAGSNSVGS